MARQVAIGSQDFAELIENDFFYVDKTAFISEWWKSGDSVTLITRPRRFGKTLNMSMLYYFFSNQYTDSKTLFSAFDIVKDDIMARQLGRWPVVFLSFADVKGCTYPEMLEKICHILTQVYLDFLFLLDSEILTDIEKEIIRNHAKGVSQKSATTSLQELSRLLKKHFGKKVIILLDEYDTPMQEAYLNGYWKEAAAFMRSFFNSTFKTNPSMVRAMLTGITHISKESMFSDLNNLNVITTTTPQYQTAFGFTEEEVFAAMDEQGLTEKEQVRFWYDGFIFGGVADIYNPWSIINYLRFQQFKPYWINTSSSGLASQLIRQSGTAIKDNFEDLLYGKTITAKLEEEVVFDQLDRNESAIWGLLTASGYLKILDTRFHAVNKEVISRTLSITNHETILGFQKMAREWFGDGDSYGYNSFVKALLEGNLDDMNSYMNRILMNSISYFDAGSKSNPENFYHGFVLGLLVELENRYQVKSNRESGFGRYDVMLIPRNMDADDGIIMEFKMLHHEKGEQLLSDTVAAALTQIEEKNHKAELLAAGLPPERIRSYGFAFEGKKVLIG